jgi:transposase
LDIGDRKSHLVCLDDDGQVRGEEKVTTTRKALEKRFGALKPCRVAIEVGVHSAWVSRLLEQCGHEVIVSNPRQIPLIFKNSRKTDRTDAECLARLARVDPILLRPIRHRSQAAQQDLALIRSRDIAVRVRAKLVSHTRAIVKSFGKRLCSCSTPSFHWKVREEIPEGIRPALDPILSLIEDLTVKIRAFDRKLQELSEHKYPETKLLRQVKGVGPMTALAYLLTLEDPRRFKKSRQVGPYLGLIGRTDNSGDRVSQLRITKEGNGYLRRLLVGSAQYILGSFGADSDLRRYGKALALRGGKNAKKRAAVAVARKLCVLLHHLWATGEIYEPLMNSTRKERKYSRTG